uniref:Putative ovule protein n=1 Tax=Solanum chacoense TaxID=4108 RepID=A0A0V0GFM7_SOLCH
MFIGLIPECLLKSWFDILLLFFFHLLYLRISSKLVVVLFCRYLLFTLVSFVSCISVTSFSRLL